MKSRSVQYFRRKKHRIHWREELSFDIYAEPLLAEATKPFDYHDGCGECGKRTDGLMLCHYSHCDDTVKLCPDCIKDSGFCLGCGHYCSGMESFDFSDVPGYCAECIREFDEMEEE